MTFADFLDKHEEWVAMLSIFALSIWFFKD